MKFRLLKEIRENGLFLIVLATIMMISVHAPVELVPFRFVLLCLCLAVGASFFGAAPLAREFTDGSAAMLLSQPVSRAQIWLEKWSVSFGCWMILAAIVWMFAPSFYSQDSQIDSELVWPTILLTLMMFFAGPLMAMIGRNVHFAILLTFGSAFWAFLLFELLLFITEGAMPGVATGASFIILSAGMLVGSYLLFLRCEDKPSLMKASLRLPLLGSKTPRAQVPGARDPVYNPIHALLQKEFRLIQTILVIDAALALLMALVFWLAPLQRTTSDAMQVMWFFVQIIVVPTLLGVTSVMGDRLPGVLEHQMTAPVSMGVQWAVKLLVCLLAAFMLLVLLIAVPYVMVSRHNPELWACLPAQLVLMAACFIIVPLAIRVRWNLKVLGSLLVLFLIAVPTTMVPLVGLAYDTNGSVSIFIIISLVGCILAVRLLVYVATQFLSRLDSLYRDHA